MTTDFPEPQLQYSLTNQIEIIQIDVLFSNGINQFDMFPNQPIGTRIKDKISAKNIFSSQYAAYIVTEIQEDKLKIAPISFEETFRSNSIYFFINKNILIERNKLEIKLFEIWRMRSGTLKMGSMSFPQNPIRFQRIMPSRGKIFR
jgi:hypothetical protein